MSDDGRLSQIALTHGQARWVLAHFNLASGVDEGAFDALLKSFRRDGLPFDETESGQGPGQNLIYKFENLMEIAVALAFRAQGILQRDFVSLIAKKRSILRPLFRRAYLERSTGLGEARAILSAPDPDHVGDAVTLPPRYLTNISGTYLSLSLNYMPGGQLTSLTCKLLGPEEALEEFMADHQNLYPRPPLPISQIASDIVRLSAGPIPEVRRGRPARAKARANTSP